jgi:exonuclease III
MIIASWNVNSIRARVEQVTAWMKAHNPDVLLLQELKGTEFLVDLFNLKGVTRQNGSTVVGSLQSARPLWAMTRTVMLVFSKL